MDLEVRLDYTELVGTFSKEENVVSHCYFGSKWDKTGNVMQFVQSNQIAKNGSYSLCNVLILIFIMYVNGITQDNVFTIYPAFIGS